MVSENRTVYALALTRRLFTSRIRTLDMERDITCLTSTAQCNIPLTLFLTQIFLLRTGQWLLIQLNEPVTLSLLFTMPALRS